MQHADETVIMLALILAVTLSQGPPQEDPGFTNIWARHGAAMDAEGITRPMAAQAYTLNEGLYHLGLSRAYLEDDDVNPEASQ